MPTDAVDADETKRVGPLQSCAGVFNVAEEIHAGLGGEDAL